MRPIDQSELAWSFTNMGNVIAAAGRADEALRLHRQALETREKEGSGDLPPLGIAYQNLARSFYMVHDHASAQKWAHSSIDYLSQSQRWAMLA